MWHRDDEFVGQARRLPCEFNRQAGTPALQKCKKTGNMAPIRHASVERSFWFRRGQRPQLQFFQIFRAEFKTQPSRL